MPQSLQKKRIIHIFGTGDSNICCFENKMLIVLHMLNKDNDDLSEILLEKFVLMFWFLELVELAVLAEPVELVLVVVGATELVEIFVVY